MSARKKGEGGGGSEEEGVERGLGVIEGWPVCEARRC